MTLGNFALAENTKIVELLTPAADAGGRTSDYISLKNAHAVDIVFSCDQGAANTIALTFNVATAVAPTGAVAMTGLAEIWSNLDCAASDTLVRRTAAVGYTTDAGDKH